ncbi:chorismate mutase [Streptomyces microflavus]|uniref:chorismate mutase n=1 Tax=Streptomyces microflavus TaxID=1919 RepID=A0A6N9VD73_STRMI|nr:MULTISPECIES: chorismate mutase [Streptomyces]MBW3361764.1 chorismate mutase [Streptomyces sp. 09ZI22]MEE1728034.1 chorismate mutase [Streptomyces sp. BE282]NEB68969.1 chorismate mutase [Streptomyces microflavus]OXY95980.1 chorismate mutase [Streptomyces sp. 2R]QKW45995.1 chorismate mutase [Streptomyces microflavus]
MPLWALRGAVQLDADEKQHLLERSQELFSTMLTANALTPDDLVSVILTATPDLRSAFPAEALRTMGLVDIPLMCAQELDIVGALPRVVRIMAHVRTARARPEAHHIYLGGAAALRRDLVGPSGDVR